MARDTMTISLPAAMMREVDQVRKREHRTRSELIREALRTYFARSYTPTARELRAIEKGRAEMKRGEYLTLNELFRHLDVDSHRKQACPKSRKARATPRARTAA